MKIQFDPTALDQRSLQELAEQLRPFLGIDNPSARGDFLINGEFYSPTINMTQLSTMWKVDVSKARKLVKAFLLFGIPIGAKEERDWLIDTEIAIECMRPEKMTKALKKIREGKV